ncbi:MAG: glycosyltransferase family 2 protein [Candidatus Gottesmanbacteria bacterium]|nr:glycosyltransferase family 2 protein [Candidatus Gottesmanbacteria bacterium]
MKVVVIIPTYNERENIIVLLDQLETVFRGLKQHTISYLVVDDTSPDGTQDLVRDYQKTHKNVYIITGKKEGLGKALLRGMTYAVGHLQADILLQMDADLSHDPKTAPQFLRAIDSGADFVVGSRYIPGGSIPENWGLIRKIYSVMGNSIVRFGLWHPRIHDWTGGYRAYTKKYYLDNREKVKGYSGYVFQIAFLHSAIHDNAHTFEVPIHFTDRRFGHSKIAPAEYIINIYKYIAVARFQEIVSGSFGKFLVVGGIGFILNAVLLVVLHNWAHWSATMANLAGAAVAIFSNYNLNNLWTFRHQKISGIGQYVIKLLQFYATSVFGVVVIQTGTIWVGVAGMGDRYYFLFFLFGTALLLIWNYFIYSKVIWKKK